MPAGALLLKDAGRHSTARLPVSAPYLALRQPIKPHQLLTHFP